MKRPLFFFSVIFIFLFLASEISAQDTRASKHSCWDMLHERVISNAKELSTQCSDFMQTANNLVGESGQIIIPILGFATKTACEIIQNNGTQPEAPSWAPDYKFGVGLAAIGGVLLVCGYMFFEPCCSCNCACDCDWSRCWRWYCPKKESYENILTEVNSDIECYGAVEENSINEITIQKNN